MRSVPRAALGMDRLVPVIVRLVAGTVFLFCALVVRDLLWLLPDPIVDRPIAMALVGLAAAYGMARAWAVRRRSRAMGDDEIALVVRMADAAGEVAVAGGLAIAVAAGCLAFLATWLPHYVLWPWHRDADTFATLAHSWDAGILPYRDIRGYNFPGAIYLHWILGKVFGWGPTWPLYVVDAAGLLGLGFTLIAWSRRTLGGVLPGLASYLVFLTFYLSLGFDRVAGRDWHTGLLVAIGLMALEAWPGRASLVVSAASTAAALTIRPHAILFLPALVLAILEDDNPPATGPPDGRPSPLRRVAAWSLMLGIFTAAAFSPLILEGIADDLMRGLSIAAYGGPYSRTDLSTASDALVQEFFQPEVAIATVLLLFMLAASRGKRRRMAVTWALALGAALLYRPIHPVHHRYLAIPLNLIGSISVALSIAWLVDRRRVPAVLRAIVALILIEEVSLGRPAFCNVPGTLKAVAAIARGQGLPVEAPPGSAGWFDVANGRWYPWADYRNVLIYLRARASPGMMVANMLREPPFPSINGPTGTLSPFLAESGICWMLYVPIDLEPEFAAALEQADDCLVIWYPGQHQYLSQLTLERLTSVIRAHYRPEARFGPIEVWCRADRAP